jgi:uncharacterized protein (DUF885 family)
VKNSKKLTFIALSFMFILGSCKQQKAEEISNVEETQTQTNFEINPQNILKATDLYPKSTLLLFNSRPTSATVYGLEESMLGGKFSDRLPDFSADTEQRMRAALRNLNKELQLLSEKDPRAEENRLVMMNLNDYFAGAENFNIGYIDTWMGLSPFIISQINGPLIDVPNNIITNQKITTIDDAKDYLSRMSQFDVFVDNVVRKAKADADEGWIPPQIIIDKSIKALESFIAPEVSDHPFVTTLKKQVSAFDQTTEEISNDLVSQAETNLTQKVYPSYQKAIEYLHSIRDKATKESGIWAQPNGAAFYADAVQKLGDTDMSPEQVHQIGLDEVNRIIAEMDTILIANGHKDGSVGERMLAINDDPQFLYDDSEAGREQLLSDLNGYIEEINLRMPEQFATKPPYAVEVRKFPKSREASAPGGMYSSPTLDGSQPGIYWINLRDIKANPKFDLKTLTYHEANPGHHWQIALNIAQDDMPMLRRLASYNAYAEGWALYSERVAWEMGMYENDPYSDLGRLKAELFRAVRLVVDTGLHYKKWDREQAIKYMSETTGTVESDVEVEIDRYMVWPGQALGYKLGMINILDQREQAKKALADKFDIKEFHDLVLLGGSVPMSILNIKIQNWIKSKM